MAASWIIFFLFSPTLLLQLAYLLFYPVSLFSPSLCSSDNLLQKPSLFLLVMYGLEAISSGVKLSASLLLLTLPQTFLPPDYPIKKTQVTLSAGCRTLLMKMNRVSEIIYWSGPSTLRILQSFLHQLFVKLESFPVFYGDNCSLEREHIGVWYSSRQGDDRFRGLVQFLILNNVEEKKKHFQWRLS